MSTIDDPPRRLCVFARLRGPGLGDLVQRNIFLAILRKAYPHADVVLIVGSDVSAQHAEFLANHCYASRVLACPENRDKDAQQWARFAASLRVENFDACVIDPDSYELDARFAAEQGIPIRIGFATGHAADQWLTAPIRLPRPLFGMPDLFEYANGLAISVGLAPLRPADVVPAFPYQRDTATSLPSPLVAVHSGGARHWNRRWPLACYAELCSSLGAAQPTSFVLIGADDEAADIGVLSERIQASLPTVRLEICLGSSLNHLANIVRAADVLVGNDSAPAHLAASLGTPSVVLYGPTLTEFMWARVYPRHVGINLRYECQTIRNLPRDAPLLTMPCAFTCHYPYVSAEGPYPRCLTDIGVAQVLAAVQRMLSTQQARRLRQPG
jgi:ADP-heptose:LPS heptosyltransferase